MSSARDVLTRASRRRTLGARVVANVIIVAMIGCSACAHARVTTRAGPTIAQVRMEPAHGPKARVAVSEFADKTAKGWGSGAIGWGMAEMLATSLFQTNRFIVLERQAVKDVLGVQDQGSSGQVAKDTSAPIGEIEGAELLVIGAVTEFEPARAYIAIDLRVVDAATSRVLLATSVTGAGRRVSVNDVVGGAVGYVAGGNVAGALGAYANTSMGDAIRVATDEAVKVVVSQTPPRYFHSGVRDEGSSR